MAVCGSSMNGRGYDDPRRRTAGGYVEPGARVVRPA
jgi:hypothetical protein